MRQGAARHALKARGNDLYETPACAVHALLDAMPDLPAVIWEPACGPGAIVRERRCPDSAHGRDFLLEQSAPHGCDTILTNPPFKIADDFIRHGLHLCPTVIVLLRLAALEGAGRSDIIDRHLRRVLIGIERLPMMHRDGWAGPMNGNSGAPFGWFVFERGAGGGTFFCERISWRGRTGKREAA